MILRMENQGTGWGTWPTVTWDKVHTHLTVLISKPVTSVFPFFLFSNIHSLFIFLLFTLLTEFFLYLIWVESYCYNYKFRVPYLFIYCLFMTKFEGRRLLGRCTEWAGIRLKLLAKICVQVSNIHLAQDGNVGHVWTCWRRFFSINCG
jgi:hypothetical protein